jgi:hypothetical protein
VRSPSSPNILLLMTFSSSFIPGILNIPYCDCLSCSYLLFLLQWLWFFYYHIIVVLVVCCVIYKSSYNISELNSPPPSFSHIVIFFSVVPWRLR